MESRNQRDQLARSAKGAGDREPRPYRGLAAPLFERLTAVGDPLRESSRPFRSFDAADARESVRRELVRLLNTRAAPVPLPPGKPLTTTDYGLPDFAHVSVGDMQARNDLALRLSRAIEAFEPRLREVRVLLEPHPTSARSLTGSILANMVIGIIAEPVSFPLEVHTRSWTADLTGPEPFAQIS